LLEGIVVMIRKRTLNRLATQCLDISELGFGTAPLGNLYKPISDDEANDALEDAWDAGIRYYDTAPLYGLGLSETRLNRFLRTKPRSEYILSSKVGRLMAPSEPADRTGIGKWFNVPSRKERYDYSYDGVMRSVEFSYERLGVSKIDILYVHDLCVFTHGSKKASDERVTEFFENGGYAAMLKLREEGIVSAIGGGINEWEVCQTLAERGDFDIFLLAGRYTLLEQTALDTFLPLCEKRGIKIVTGGPYNSGILATGPVKGAFYNYETASQSIIDRVAAIERVCTSYGVSLKAAALQFPLLHSTHLSVVPGAQSAEELNNNLEVYKAVIPSSLWSDLKAEGLLRQDAPVT
jgi:D-threo-aldose 1-dehydrogenase